MHYILKTDTKTFCQREQAPKKQLQCSSLDVLHVPSLLHDPHVQYAFCLLRLVHVLCLICSMRRKCLLSLCCNTCCMCLLCLICHEYHIDLRRYIHMYIYIYMYIYVDDPYIFMYDAQNLEPLCSVPWPRGFELTGLQLHFSVQVVNKKF